MSSFSTSNNWNNFLTCGNDKLVSLWDGLNHKNLWRIQLEEKLHCVGTHPILSNLVALGTVKSLFYIFDLSKKEVVHKAQIEGSTEQIECIKYSQSGALLACASRDNYMYIFEVSEDGLSYKRVGKCAGHSSFITHIDWSADSKYLMSNSGDYEVLYWDMTSNACKQMTSVQEIREIKWATNSCVLSFNTIGMWNNSVQTKSSNEISSSKDLSMDGTDINACCGSELKNVLVSADDFGQVNLLRYPCNSFSAEKKAYNGHSSHVTNVTFLNNNQDNIVLSSGGMDMSIFQWKLIDE